MESTQGKESEKEKYKEWEKSKTKWKQSQIREKNENKCIATKNQFEALGEETPEITEDERPQKKEKK